MNKGADFKARTGHFPRCTNCGKDLKGEFVYLELNSFTGLYVDPDKLKIVSQESQGVFPFGKDCARAILANGGRI